MIATDAIITGTAAIMFKSVGAISAEAKRAIIEKINAFDKCLPANPAKYLDDRGSTLDAASLRKPQ